ncbi:MULTISPECIES: prepilin-type N-terminal cleavage/methylation domain-containing protein [Aeromonas]|uniref:prepilin-type N-terminal cleavage/methylation domain-containing protein n=1 Tax=Aeromonas TaxID=642 RepID=UPI001C48A4FC|nr:prepilin-type N-terminal cleavage/methylation domain-containing protein [Aeromonas sp. sif0611]MBV7471570.1 prepilin-type N-terminal cleavage/methylation domain-containing protein [Aeromonas sp. sif0611]
MKKQAGFTLIELVIVIIILGILAVTAAPKFLNLQDDAKAAAAQGVQAALQSASGLVYSKAALEGVEASSTEKSVSVAGGTVKVLFGYPIANADGIVKAVNLDGWEISGSGSTDAGGTANFYPTNAKGDSCYVVYTAATSTSIATAAVSGSLATCK